MSNNSLTELAVGWERAAGNLTERSPRAIALQLCARELRAAMAGSAAGTASKPKETTRQAESGGLTPERAAELEQKVQADHATARKEIRREIARRSWSHHPPATIVETAATLLVVLRIFFQADSIDEQALNKVNSAAAFCVDAALLSKPEGE